MSFTDLINLIFSAASGYTSHPALATGSGTWRELNNAPPLLPTQPLLWLLTEPEWVDISEDDTGREQYTFLLLVLQPSALDADAAQCQDIYHQCKSIGDGIVHRLREDENFSQGIRIISVNKSLRLKAADDALTGLAYRLRLETPPAPCTYPFSWTAND